jgi:hypothetical protein
MKHCSDFKMFVQFVVSDELSKPEPASPEVLHRRLWSAAQHDIFLRTGGIATMNEEQTGFLRIDDGAYRAAINAGMARLAEAGYLLKTDQADRIGMSAASRQIQDCLVEADGRLVVFDKGHSAFGPLRPLPG